MRLVKTHGSLNEIFALAATPASWGSEAGLREFVRRVCDRDGWTGGSDGIYLYDASSPRTQAWFFNPDGSSAELCGNGMRGLGRLILDQRGTEAEVIESGGRAYAVHRAPSTPEGVRQVLLELPAVRFGAPPPPPFDNYTAVSVPNPHVIAVVAEYSELDLIEAGKRADVVFAEGANVSFLLPLTHSTSPTPTTPAVPPAPGTPTAPPATFASEAPEVFVRTFERGAGLTPSCGSGVVASRAAYSRVTGLDPGQRLVVRNAGGVAAASIRVRGSGWFPALEGNATVVYRTEVDLSGRQSGSLDYDAEENAAYASLDEQNTAYLKANGVTTAHP
jgi:diaminopimelate epimerase